MKKTVIFGGTFNPVHLGHTEMLASIAEREDVEKVFVMPVNLPPHKSVDVASAEDRVNMCRLAFSGIEKVAVSDFEIKMAGKSYTINTLERLKEKGIVNPYLVIGGDSLINFHRWVRYEDILRLAGLMVYRRKGTDDIDFQVALDSLRKKCGNIILLDITPIRVSSTEVREKIKKGDSILDLLPKDVIEYIKKKSLYSEE